MDSSHPLTTPDNNHTQLCKEDLNDPRVESKVPFKEAIGCIMFANILTCLDISFAMSKVAQFQN